MKVVAVVQARVGSTRLPNKVLLPICGTAMVELLLRRLSRSKNIDEIVIATSKDERNKPLIRIAESIGISCVVGSEDDVLERFVVAASKTKADVIVRITGDCPLTDPQIVDACIVEFLRQGVDYLSNVDPATYPDGLDVEVFSYSALEKSNLEARLKFDREHVTTYIRHSNQFSCSSIANSEDLSHLRWTVDEYSDFQVVSSVFEYFSPDIHFSWKKVLELQLTNGAMFSANENIERNEGAFMGTGQKLWKRAKRVIPGGNMLLSKRSEMFLPELWPSYFSKARGCKVWDLDGNCYIDMSIMGVGTNILGYGHEEVDEAVCKTVQEGNMSTLNCPEEVYLAEKLVEIHPWADMVRFARSGGEANAVAIRIARAASGRDKVAICGYHGWHDWYLSVNLGSEQGLDGHLLPGLQPNGVPRNLRGTVFPFKYNDFCELERLVNEHDIGVIKMEVVRNNGPENDFLNKVRKLATDRGIVLIFDECTSGFRQSFGGLHAVYGVEPDMAMFGKALGNGYAITATIGRREVMEAAQSTFISSTFWTERIGPTAALATLKVMENTRSWETITKIGSDIRDNWKKLAEKYGLMIDLWGLPALSGFTIQSESSQYYKTLITQEMLKKGFLASNSIYSCIDHTPDVVAAYFDALNPIFELIRECEDGRNVSELLHGPVCHDGFKRLN